MARLMQAALPLLLVASFVHSAAGITARDQGIKDYAGGDKFIDYRYKNMEANKNYTSVKFEKSLEYLQSANFDSYKDAQSQIDFLEGLLVAKTCFREWVRDEDCHMREFEAAYEPASALTDEAERVSAQAAVKEKYPVGAASHFRLKKQISDLKEIQATGNGYFRNVTIALQQNFNEMVAQAKDDDSKLKALEDHFGAEFGDIFKSLKEDLQISGFAGIADDIKQHMVKMAMNDWVEQEKRAQEKGELQKQGWDHERWEQMMNKIPSTAKYNTRGSSPVSKPHLAKFLDVLNDKKYENLKDKSADFLMARANQLRHEAMEKSSSIIAYVMHKMKEDDSGHNMAEMTKAMGNKKEMDHMLGHRKNAAGKHMHM